MEYKSGYGFVGKEAPCVFKLHLHALGGDRLAGCEIPHIKTEQQILVWADEFAATLYIVGHRNDVRAFPEPQARFVAQIELRFEFVLEPVLI